MTESSAILSRLTDPRQLLVFCDESEIAGSVRQDLASDLLIMCAVVIRSEKYEIAQLQMEEKLQSLGADLVEFHATDMVNPSTRSPWRGIPVSARIEGFDFLRDVLVAATSKLYYAYLSKAQYAELRTKAEETAPIHLGYRKALKKVFLRSLFERLSLETEPTVLILDQDKPLEAPTKEEWPEGTFLVGRGPILADSVSVRGLQLADIAAYAVTRYLRKRPELGAGDANGFNLRATQILANLGDRTECIYNRPDGTASD